MHILCCNNFFPFEKKWHTVVSTWALVIFFFFLSLKNLIESYFLFVFSGPSELVVNATERVRDDFTVIKCGTQYYRQISATTAAAAAAALEFFFLFFKLNLSVTELHFCRLFSSYILI